MVATEPNPEGSGARLAQEAVKALHDPAFEGTPGYCQRFVRQVIAAVFGEPNLYDRFMAPSAYLSMLLWGRSAYRVWEWGNGRTPTLMPGDILYKGRLTSGPFGHVGIVFHNEVEGHAVLCVAENSSYHVNPEHEGDVSGAKGWRDIHAFGDYEMVVRLI